MITPVPSNYQKVKNYGITLVPSWIAKILTSKKLPISAVLDLNILTEVLSYNDIGCLYALQEKSEKVFGFSLDTYGLDGVGQWYKLPAAYGIVENLTKIADEDLKSRLLYLDDMHLSEAEADAQESFSILIGEGNHFFAVIEPGYFTETGNNVYRKKLIHSLTKAIYDHSGFDTLTQSSLFIRYVENLVSA